MAPIRTDEDSSFGHVRDPYHDQRSIVIRAIGNALGMDGTTQIAMLKEALKFIKEGKSKQPISNGENENGDQQVTNHILSEAFARIQELERKLAEADATISELRQKFVPANNSIMNSGYNPTFPPQFHQPSNFPQQQMMTPGIFPHQMYQHPFQNGFMMSPGMAYPPQYFPQPMMQSFQQQMMAQRHAVNQMCHGTGQVHPNYPQPAPQQQLFNEFPQAQYYRNPQNQAVEHHQSLYQPVEANHDPLEGTGQIDYQAIADLPPVMEAQQEPALTEDVPDQKPVLHLANVNVERQQEQIAPLSEQPCLGMAQIKAEHGIRQTQQLHLNQEGATLASVKVEPEKEQGETDDQNSSEKEDMYTVMRELNMHGEKRLHEFCRQAGIPIIKKEPL